MEGAVELAEEVFHMPVRLGSPQYVEGLSDVVRNPIHATGVGLLMFGQDSMDKRNYNNISVKNSLNDKIEQVKNWIQKQF
jgi:cell division protein FtsA